MPYRILEEIGHGGMGCVYKAEDDSSGQTIALKMMSSRVTCYPEYRKLFQAEVDTLRRMNHPSVVHIIGEPYQDGKGNLYLPMEFVEGKTLEQVVRERGPLPCNEAVAIMCEILDAMQYVHSRQRIHRDIKPSNIMLRPNRSVCIIDFGIAKDARVGTGQTVGRIIGTDGYMSPEQAGGLNIDARTDIYSLGLVLYYLITGQNAISKGKNDYETVCNILNEAPGLPSRISASVSPEIDEIFIKAVDKNMTQRYQTAAAFREALLAATGHAIPKVSIGRLAENDIQIDHPDVSRRHLVVTIYDESQTGGQKRTVIEITDTSTNGTGVNGRLLKHKSETVNYTDTSSLPQVYLAGRPELMLNWLRVMDLLRAKGWRKQSATPVAQSEAELPVPASSEAGEDTLSVAGILISIFIPIVGLAIWLKDSNSRPRRANLAISAASAGAVIWILSIINIYIL